MRYSVLGGGKRIRPALVFATARTLGLTEEQVEAAACAIELIHVYSLVHDDLPAMDDDDLRRGRPTCHKAYDEATAILVGDALQPLAFQLLARDPALPAAARDPPAAHRPAERGERHLRHGRRPGHRSRGPGQQARYRPGRGHARAQDRRDDPRERADGRGMRCRIWRPRIISALERFAAAIGLAFQIQDDLLDVTRRCVDARQGDRCRPRTRQAHASGDHRHRGLAAARGAAARPGARSAGAVRRARRAAALARELAAVAPSLMRRPSSPGGRDTGAAGVNAARVFDPSRRAATTGRSRFP